MKIKMLDEDADLWYLRSGKTAQRSFGWGQSSRTGLCGETAI